MGKDKKELSAPTLFKFTSVSTKVLLSWDTDRSSLPGGGIPHKRGGDARRFDYGCKFWILVSLRVFWAKRYYI